MEYTVEQNTQNYFSAPSQYLGDQMYTYGQLLAIDVSLNFQRKCLILSYPSKYTRSSSAVIEYRVSIPEEKSRTLRLIE